MSDLIITHDKLDTPPGACSKDPPAPPPPPKDGKPATTTAAPKDDCFFQVPLIDDLKSKDKPRVLRFDRQGTKFVISPQNSADNLTWLGEHGNVTQVTDALRISESVLRLLGNPATDDSFRILLTIAQYVVTGKIWLGKPAFNPEIRSAEGTELEMASYLLELFTFNPEQAVAKLLGAVSVFRGDTSLPGDAANRIKWIQDIYGLRNNYIKFRKHFTDIVLLNEEFEKLGSDEKMRVAWLLAFCRLTVIQQWQGKAFKYDDVFVQVFKDFSQTKSRKGDQDDFCKVLQAALKDLGAKLPDTFGSDCLAAFQLAQMKPETAVKQSIKRGLIGEEGRAFMQNEIKDESKEAKMDVSWLFSRGRLGEVADIFGRHLKTALPKKSGDSLGLELDFAKFSSEVSVLIGTNMTIQREYIVSALALSRRLFDSKGKPRSLRVFLNGEFIDVGFKTGKTDPADIVDFMKGLKRKLNLSETRTEKWLPVAEASLCVAGIGGLVVSQGLMEDGGELQRGVGISSAGAAGAGCSALAGHYLWPKVTTVRNRYAWEGLTGAAGSVVGIGLYFLAKSIFSDKGSPIKYPVDEYGP
jgi:hypothetical protein